MKKKNTIHQRMFCGLISGLMLLSAGCGSTDNQNGTSGRKADEMSVHAQAEQQPSEATADAGEEMRTEAAITIPAHVEKQLNKKLQVDAKVSTALDVGSTLYSYQAKPAMIEGQKLKDMFFETDEEVTIDEKDSQILCRSADDTKRASWVKGLYTSFSSMEHLRYLTVISASGNNSALPETLHTVGTLPFMSEAKAQALVKETASRLGIALADKPYAFFALDEATLTRMYEEAAAKLPEGVVEDYLPDVDFAGDKGCYYMLWQQLCPHGEAMMSSNIGLNVKGFTVTMGNYVMAIVNENGLVSFRSGNKYDYANESVITEMIDVDTALEKIRELYKTVPLEEQYCITNITLQYVAVLEDKEAGSYRIIPAWCMETSEDNYRLFVVDAVKGVIL